MKMSKSTNQPHQRRETLERKPYSRPSILLLSLLGPVLVAALVYRLDDFDPAPLPTHEFTRQPIPVPRRNLNLLRGAEKVGFGQLLSPEDLAYDSDSGVIYTGCVDGWIKRVKVSDSGAEWVVENWVNTGGRPLGLVLGRDGELFIADADKGLLKVTRDGSMELLSREADGNEFMLTDGVDVAEDGTLYFTDASYKHAIKDSMRDILEGRPYGRLLSYDPSTKETKVLLSNLYFANGVTVSPDQNSVLFCETPMRRCRRYYVRGEKKGSVENFIDGLPGMPDNIHYDADGHYWIALVTEVTSSWDMAQRYPFIRKVFAIVKRYVWTLPTEKNGGVLAVDIEGKPTTIFCDPNLSFISSGIRINDHLLLGSVQYPYIIRLNMTKNPAVPRTGDL